MPDDDVGRLSDRIACVIDRETNERSTVTQTVRAGMSAAEGEGARQDQPDCVYDFEKVMNEEKQDANDYEPNDHCRCARRRSVERGL
jgi:hypothetical protein